MVAIIPAVLILSLMPSEHVPGPKLNDKLLHLMAFLVISGLFDAAWPRCSFNWQKALAVVAYGALIEILQSFTGYRDMSGADLVADIIGIGLYVIMIPLWRIIPIINIRWQYLEASPSKTNL